jgi:hypothetical protein
VPAYSGDPAPGRFAGKYLDPRKQMVYSFTAADGNLMAWGAALRRIGPNQFMDLGTGKITFNDAGTGMKATLEIDGGPFFEGMRIEEPKLSEAELAAYAGTYKSGEIGATYTLSVRDGKLTLRNGWAPEVTLAPLTEDEFDSDALGRLVFHRDANHRINGFGLYSGSVRNVGFEKAM